MMRVPAFLCLAAVLAVPVRAAVPEQRTLDAIAAVESGNRCWVVGSFGERSVYQFMETTWRQYTPAPFARATTDPELAAAVARLHFRAIVRRLERAARPVTVKAIARAWNPGAPADYAQRVENLVNAK